MNYQKAISSYKRTWVIGKCLKTILLVAVLFLLAMILYGLADSVWAMDNSARTLANYIIFGFTALAALFLIVKAIRTPQPTIASLADQASANPANNIRAAADLSTKESISPLQGYLSELAQEKAAEELKGIPLKSKIPFKQLGYGILGLGAVAATIFGLRTIHPQAFDTVYNRLTHPSQDIPPYSPLQFEITQTEENTIYGSSNQVRVKITGAEIEEDVICLVRDPNTNDVERINTFQEEHNVFSKKFNSVVTDLEYSFSTGKARSEWKKINVLLQPKFTNAVIRITPPSYTKRKPIEFPLEGNEIKAIHGSTITLTVTSNRPLSAGEINITELSDKQPDLNELVSATTSSESKNQVSFTWLATQSSNITCNINDVRGTISAIPLQFSILTRADLAPVADISFPAKYVQATPNSIIPLKGSVEDDYELSDVYLVRTLQGYRDRAKIIAQSVQSDTYEFRQQLDLSSIGVKPKDILEFYLESNDKNPSLLGIGTSSVVRVEIISEEEYAARLRSKLKMEQFNIRYIALNKAIKEAIASLEEFKIANKKEQLETFKGAREHAFKTHSASREEVFRISQDFEAFETEKKLTKIAEQTAQTLLTNLEDLSAMDFNSGTNPNDNIINILIERLRPYQEEAQELEDQAEKLKLWGDVAQQAAVFLKLYNNQKSIASRITRIAQELSKGIRRNVGQLEPLGQTQQKNKKQLEQFAKDLKKAAAALPEEYAELAKDCDIFLEKMQQLNIPDPMDAATLSCTNGKSHDAVNHAYLAYTLMKELIDMEDNEFADMINGRPPKPPEDADEDMEEAMKQMLQALLQQAKGGGGGKGGMGQNGGGQGGFGGGGDGLNRGNAPMFGPSRNEYQSPGSAGKGKGKGNGLGKGNGRTPKLSGKNSIESSKKRDTNTNQSTRTNVPDKYKDAVKRFYSEEQK